MSTKGQRNALRTKVEAMQASGKFDSSVVAELALLVLDDLDAMELARRDVIRSALPRRPMTAREINRHSE